MLMALVVEAETYNCNVNKKKKITNYNRIIFLFL